MNLALSIVTIAVGGVTFLGAMAKLVSVVYSWGRRVERALTYVEHEMRHNGGESMKDHVVHIHQAIEAADEREGR